MQVLLGIDEIISPHFAKIILERGCGENLARASLDSAKSSLFASQCASVVVGIHSTVLGWLAHWRMGYSTNQGLT
jgi:hypothetical protein